MVDTLLIIVFSMLGISFMIYILIGLEIEIRRLRREKQLFQQTLRQQ